jgi:hypothetical protein
VVINGIGVTAAWCSSSYRQVPSRRSSGPLLALTLSIRRHYRRAEQLRKIPVAARPRLRWSCSSPTDERTDAPCGTPYVSSVVCACRRGRLGRAIFWDEAHPTIR